MAKKRATKVRVIPQEQIKPLVTDFRTAEPDQYAAVQAMIPLAEGKPAVCVRARDRSAFALHRVHGLRVAPKEWAFYGKCEWVDPPDARPEELPTLMSISCGDCLRLGPGWWYDAYFHRFWVYDPPLVARSLAGDHSWVPAFLAAAYPPEAEPDAPPDRGGSRRSPGRNSPRRRGR